MTLNMITLNHYSGCPFICCECHYAECCGALHNPRKIFKIKINVLSGNVFRLKGSGAFPKLDIFVLMKRLSFAPLGDYKNGELSI